MQQLFKYVKVDELCANTALKAFSRNFWYLTKVLIPSCSFSHKLTTAQKEGIATEDLFSNVSFQIPL